MLCTNCVLCTRLRFLNLISGRKEMICFTCFEINQIISSFHNYFPEKLKKQKQKQKQNKQTNKHKKKKQTNKQKSVRRNFVLYTLWVVFVKHV